MCKHTSLLRLAGKDDLYVHYTDRLTRVLQQLPSPRTQSPQTVLFLGTQTKDAALRSFKFNGARQDTFLNLHLDATTVDTEHPCLLIEGDVHHVIPPFFTSRDLCHEEEMLSLTWDTRPGAPAVVVLVRLLFLFTDVVFIFADDYGGMEQVAKILRVFAEVGRRSTLPHRVRPTIVIVSADQHASDEVCQSLLGVDTMAAQDECFSPPKVICLNKTRSNASRFSEVKTVLGRETATMLEVRQSYHVLFSALHLEAFFNASLRHISHTLSTPFSFIEATRVDNPLTPDYSSNLRHFISLARELRVPFDHILAYIASSIVMDSSPPGMHAFPIHDVFNCIYETPCLTALLEFAPNDLVAEVWKSHIEETARTLSWSLEKSIETSAGLHARNALDRRRKFAPLRSTRLCLFCLRRQNEHFLSCGHGICDVCVRVFGVQVPAFEHQYEVSSCLPCGSRGQTRVKQLPPTAGFRILSIDGGGVGGSISLEILKLLQSTLSSPIQDFFDVVFATSSGALITLGLFSKGWDVAKCAQVFHDLSIELFRKEVKNPLRVISRLRELYRTFVEDGYHDPVVFERLLRACFGAGQRLFAHSKDVVSGTKIGVTATDIRNTTTVIFSNYNGAERLSSISGYRQLRAQHTQDEPLLWEIGRATAAAPPFLPPTNVSKFGFFQDGGLGYNNPVSLADRESKRIWPTASGIDVALSLGTGAEACTSPKAARFRSILRDGFLPRLVRSISSFINGDKQYMDWLSGKDETTREKCIRLNSYFPIDEAIRLDDTSKMASMKARVHEEAAAPGMARKYTDAAVKILASCFYFELNAEPIFESGRYHCYGAVRCRNNPQSVITALRNLDVKPRILNDTFILGLVLEQDICPHCRTYKLPVVFSVRQLSELVNLFIKTESATYQIAGFGQTVNWYVAQSGFRCAFGRADHGIPGKIICTHCTTPRGRKRKPDQEDQSPTRNKRLRSRP